MRITPEFNTKKLVLYIIQVLSESLDFKPTLTIYFNDASYPFRYRGTSVAIKEFNLSDASLSDAFVRELETLSALRHRHLVQVLGYCLYNNFGYLVLELAENASLEAW